MRNVCTALLMLLAGSAQAAPVTWTIDNLLWDDGGTASGTFVYDADTSTYSNVAILSTAGSLLGGSSYSYLNPTANITPSASALYPVASDASDLTGVSAIQLLFNSILTNAGGIVTLSPGSAPSAGSAEGFCADAVCSYGTGPARYLVSGQISAIPVPAAVWLFASGLGLLGWIKRSQHSH